MTEDEWLTGRDSQSLLKYLQGQSSSRTLRLYAVACCSRLFHFLVDERSRQALQTAELFSDRQVTEKERATAERNAAAAMTPELWTTSSHGYAAAAVAQAVRRNKDIWHAAYQAAFLAESAVPKSWEERLEERATHATLLREIFGNPFRPVEFDAEWRTSTVTQLAKWMYESRDFSTMPILADALQDAGCNNADVLNHCRDANATHVRGCWVVDLVLGKE